MKNIFKLLFLLCLPLSLASCGETPVVEPSVAAISLNATVINLEVNDTFTLTPEAIDSDGNKLENVEYKYFTANPAIAKVEANGKITALKAGTSTISCVSGKQIASCLVKVAGSEDDDVYALSFSPDSVIIKIGGSYTPNVVTYPEGVRGLDYLWYSNDESVVTVADGVINAVGLGSTDVQVVYGTLNAKLHVTVDEKGSDVFTISLDKHDATMLVGSELQLNATTSESATITWESEDSGVASVDKNGLVSANGKGSTKISATANGKTATCNINVTDGTDPGGDTNLEVFFYIDFNNADDADNAYAKLDWYVGVPFGSKNKPADPAQAPDPAFPKFAGWSSHPIIDNIPDDLWNFEEDVVPDGSYTFALYGIWIDA